VGRALGEELEIAAETRTLALFEEELGAAHDVGVSVLPDGREHRVAGLHSDERPPGLGHPGHVGR
jgi:hypothetical protein